MNQLILTVRIDHNIHRNMRCRLAWNSNNTFPAAAPR